MSTRMDGSAAHELGRIADTIVDGSMTMRDRFALAIVASGYVAARSGNPASVIASRVYDLADALDAERRRRNEQDGR